MRRSRSQLEIDFPVRKSSRSRSKLTDGDAKSPATPKRRSRLDSIVKTDLTPHKSPIRSPAKRRMMFDDPDEDPTENFSPSKRRTTAASSPLVRSVRTPLSPRQDKHVSTDTTNLTSPRKPGYHTPSARALTFTPKKDIENCPTLDTKPKSSRKLFSSLSPVKRCTAPTTPSKFTGLRGCESPVKSLNSPLRNSSILSPVKNHHVSPVKRLLLSPRKCGSPVKRLGIESPRKESTYSPKMRLARQEGVCYQKAKQALHTALPEKLLCREKEYEEVNSFLDTHLSKKKAGSMYISGAPGTGKTAVLSKTLNRIQEEGKYPVIYINCMSFKNSAAIYNRVLSELEGKESRLSAKDATLALEKAFTSRKSMVMMILDEVDQLDSKNQEVLYTMFEWPALDKSKLVLIGIANALDLTDRVLPRLQAHPKCKPRLMSFAPYTRNQLVTILTDRLARVSVGGEPVLEPAAIQFCARKVSSQAGDMRKALDVCRRAVEMVEADVRKQHVLNGSTPSGQAVPKKIGVGHILKIINEVYGSRVTVQGEQTIPLQQKLAICTLLLLRKRGTKKQITLGKLHESFSSVCRHQNVTAVDQGEFHALLGLLEARGLLALSRAKDTRSVKVTLRLDDSELETALQDKTLMSAVLAKGLK